MDKYKLTDETIIINGHILHRIQALKNFDFVAKGDLGGFVESEKNLSHEGNCWIYDNAKVYGNASIIKNAEIYDRAEIFDKAFITDLVNVGGSAKIFGNAYLANNVIIRGKAKIYDNAYISRFAIIDNDACIFENATITNDAIIKNSTKIYGDATIGGEVIVRDTAEISGNVKISGESVIQGNAIIESISDFIIFKNWWSSGRTFTWTKSNNMWSVGCFYGTGEELIEKAYKDSEKSGREYERVVNYVKSILNGN